MPPVSKLTPEQTSFNFINGYTSKLAGTEVGITDPQMTFSACFGEAFIVLHPNAYAKMLAAKMQEHEVDVWLVNSGWVGGKYGVGKRMDLKSTRAILDAIHDGSLAKGEFVNFPVFNMAIPTTCNGVDDQMLNPANAWEPAEFDAALRKLGKAFNENHKKYADGCDAAINAAAP